MLKQAYDAGYQEALEKVGGIFDGLGRMAATAGQGIRKAFSPMLSRAPATPALTAMPKRIDPWTKAFGPNAAPLARQAQPVTQTPRSNPFDSMIRRSEQLDREAAKAQRSVNTTPRAVANAGPERDYLAPYRSPTSYGGGGSMNPGPSNAMDPATGLFRRGGE